MNKDCRFASSSSRRPQKEAEGNTRELSGSITLLSGIGYLVYLILIENQHKYRNKNVFKAKKQH